MWEYFVHTQIRFGYDLGSWLGTCIESTIWLQRTSSLSGFNIYLYLYKYYSILHIIIRSNIVTNITVKKILKLNILFVFSI